MERFIRIVLAVLLAVNIYMFYAFYNAKSTDNKKDISIADNRRSSVVVQDDSEMINDFLHHIALAEEVLDGYPLSTSDEVIELWASGVIERNGVKQYTAMSGEMKNKFKDYLAARDNTSWVTGNDDEMIESYEIAEKNIISDRVVIYKLEFINGGEKFSGDFTVVYDGVKWAMTQITMFEA